MEAVRACIADWTAAWGRMDVAALTALTDRDEPQPYYLPEEAEAAPFRSWAAVDRYWAEAARLFPGGVKLATSDHIITAIDDGLVLSHFAMRWGLVPAPGQPGIGGENRVSQIWRARPDGWRLIHHAEAPMATAPWVMSLYAARAAQVDAP